MEGIKTYEEYEKLFNSPLVIAVRNVLEMIEDHQVHNLEDSPQHNELIRYFNKFGLHGKITEKQFNEWKK